MKLVWMCLAGLALLSCNTKTVKVEETKDSVVYSTDRIPEIRTKINFNPVKTYQEIIKTFATTDEFRVSLFETKKTFEFFIKIKYKNLEEQDTLRVPNFGEVPKVEIKKGAKRPSCVVGFLDNNKQFREVKLIYFEDDKIKVHVLKHYGVFAR